MGQHHPLFVPDSLFLYYKIYYTIPSFYYTLYALNFADTWPSHSCMLFENLIPDLVLPLLLQQLPIFWLWGFSTKDLVPELYRILWKLLIWSSCYWRLHLVLNPLYLLWWSLLFIVDFDADMPTCSWSGQLLWKGFSSSGKEFLGHAPQLFSVVFQAFWFSELTIAFVIFKTVIS